MSDRNSYGFSLMETLVALTLLTTIALTILDVCGENLVRLQRAAVIEAALDYLDNVSEALIAGVTLPVSEKFTLDITNSEHGKTLAVNCKTGKACNFSRTV